ncbi:MAG: ATP-binding protein [Cellulosilyticaceae bacterium]
MKKKIIIPVLVILWAVGLSIIGYASSLVAGNYLSNHLDQQMLINIRLEIFYKGLIVLSIGTVVAYLILSSIIKAITEPISSLIDEAGAFAKGEYRHNVKHYDIEEIEELYCAFDNMGEKLYRTIRKLKYQKTKAESILTHLDQGIMVLDQEAYVLELNQVVEEMLGIRGVRGNNYHIRDILRDGKCGQMITEAIDKNIYSSCEIRLGEKIFYIKTRPIGEESKKFGYIVTIQDITNIRKLEEMRYQFVSNVTHELKTPLTSIQGFVETLKDGAIEDKVSANRFLDIIDIEAKRLYRLIQDILLLSEIESMDNIYTESTYVHEVVEEVINLLEEEARKKHIDILFDEQDVLVLPCTNRDHIKQMVINIVSNALRYTDSGEITIMTRAEGDSGIIQVKDTGIGISQESIKRIFERFYRADKSRSRKSGGTGLGLSIVKHIVGLYKGKITVESEEGQGSTFTIEMPIV